MFSYFETFIRVVYPIFQSLKYLKKKDSEGIISVLQYWCLNWILSFIEVFLPYLMNNYVSTLIVFLLNFYLIYDKFKGSSTIFNAVVTPLMDRYNKQLQEFFTMIELHLKKTTQTGVEMGLQQVQKAVPSKRLINLQAIRKQVTRTVVDSLSNPI